MEDMKPVFIVSGCGVTFIGEEGPILQDWINDLVARGGSPIIRLMVGSQAA